MYRRGVRKRRNRIRYSRRGSRLLFPASGYSRETYPSFGRKTSSPFGKIGQRNKASGYKSKSKKDDDFVYVKPGGYLRGYKGPVHMSTQMERVAKSVAGRQWRKALQGDWKTLEYKGYKFPLPNDYQLMRAGNYVVPFAQGLLHAKAHVESMPWTGDPSPRDEL